MRPVGATCLAGLTLLCFGTTAFAQALPRAPGAYVVAVSAPEVRGNEPSIAVNPRNPAQVVGAYQGPARAVFSTVAVLLYGALAALVLIWAARGEWLDAYDALLWLIAFVTIELDLIGVNKVDAAPIKSC